MSCWQKFRLFTKQTCKDICRHKCQFCLSFCSVFVVVLSILIVVSITEKGPTIFLRLSEKTTGEFDAEFENSAKENYFLNYTQAQSVTDKRYNLAPRMHYYDSTYVVTLGFKNARLAVIDTDREKEIGLGTQYPYGPLGSGECIISKDYEDYPKIRKNGEIKLQVNLNPLVHTQIKFFNEHRP